MVVAASVLAMVLAAAVAPAPAGPKCPSESEIRGKLGLAATPGQVACRIGELGQMLMVAMLPTSPERAVPHLVVGVLRNEYLLKTELDLAGPEEAEVRQLHGEQWKVAIAPARLRGADWLRVDLTGRSGEDLVITQTVVSFFRVASGRVQPLWTGLGERHELRFGACGLDTRAEFLVAVNGALIRRRRTSRRFGDPGGMDGAQLKDLKAGCLASPTRRDAFEVADDGLNADVAVSPALAERARANRRLFLRAAASPQAFSRFVADSLSLLELVHQEAMAGTPDDPEASDYGIATSGAWSYVVEGGVRRGLMWNNLRLVAGRDGGPLVTALEHLEDGGLGVWIEPQTDYGGCHQPEKGTAALQALADAWRGAGEPLREAFGGYLAGELEDMAYPCFCAPVSQRAAVQKALERNATILDGIGEPAAEAARKLRSLTANPEVAFGCVGPH